MKLVGFRSQMAAMERLLDRAADGTGAYTLIIGPPGAGKSALLAAVAQAAHDRRIPVVRVGAPYPDAPAALWTRLQDEIAADPNARHADTADQAARHLARSGPRVLLLDDVDRYDSANTDTPTAAAFLTALAAQLTSGSTLVIATAATPFGPGPHLPLPSLSKYDLADLLATSSPSAANLDAVWLASGGLPGPALDAADRLTGLEPGSDPVAHLALTTQTDSTFLDVNAVVLRLLETAAERHPLPDPVRARVLARLARELLGDSSAADRRRELIDQATALAEQAEDPGVLAEVLESGLHALWDPAAAHERLSTASRIVALARTAGDAAAERRGLFWRFTALVELGRLDEAEAALTGYARAGEQAGDPEAAVVVLSRQAMLTAVRGRFEEALALADEVSKQGSAARIPDTLRLVGSLHHAVAMLRDDASGQSPDGWLSMARRLPGHYYEAAAARALAGTGQPAQAAAELERLLPALLRGSGPRWLGAVADLAAVAASSSHQGDPARARALYDALAPYQGRLVIWGGANTVTGPVDEYLGRLADRLGEPDLATTHFTRAADLAERNGALPWLARNLAARARLQLNPAASADLSNAQADLHRAHALADRLGMRLPPDDTPTSTTTSADTWRLERDGSDWTLYAGPEHARLRDVRGLHYLRSLLTAPGREIPALDLVAGGPGLASATPDPMLDVAAHAAYVHRLKDLDEQLDAADLAGDAAQSHALATERRALLAELRRVSRPGGRSRDYPDEAERARVNATRALWSAVDRVQAAAPLAGTHLRAALRTGRVMRYEPSTPGGPARWSV